MIISPPFLPTAQADADSRGHAATEGTFPIAQKLAWHGGLHLTAPAAGNARSPVRAIADGTVVFKRDPTARNQSHALAYNGWTDDGCIIIRHDTSIGASATEETEVRFFSIYMHLDRILPAVQQGQPIQRKAQLGRAGMIEGQPNLIHFEIICDDTNLEKLIGRAIGQVDTGTDGRTDSVFGEIYFRLPSGTPIYSVRPAMDQTTGQNGSPTTEELFVGLRYENGNLEVRTYRTDGTIAGEIPAINDAEYDIYLDAKRIVQSYRRAGAVVIPAHSAVFELLRYGRTLGPDTLTPADTPHWREINTGTTTGWVNLNASGICKYSDADAPHWAGWHLISDYSDADSRCDANIVRNLLDEDSNRITTRTEAERRIQNPAIQGFLQGLVCKFPTEWHAGSVAQRWGWLMREGPNGSGTAKPSLSNNTYLTETDFPDFERYVQALAFWEEARLGIPEAHWHFHPLRFIEHFAKCTWISRDELKRIYPDSAYPIRALGIEGRGRTPDSIRDEYRNIINQVTRKYFINTPARLAHFYGQGAVESMHLALMVEGSASFSRNPQHASFQSEEAGYYAPTNPNDYLFYLEGRLGNADPGDGPKFRGRGMKQLTGRENYAKYWVYRGWLDENSFDPRWWTSKSLRRPIINNPQALSINAYNCIDAGGWYWQAGAASNRFRTINTEITSNLINRTTVRVVSRAINGVNRSTGDPNGLTERIQETTRSSSVLLDETMR